MELLYQDKKELLNDINYYYSEQYILQFYEELLLKKNTFISVNDFMEFYSEWEIFIKNDIYKAYYLKIGFLDNGGSIPTASISLIRRPKTELSEEQIKIKDLLLSNDETNIQLGLQLLQGLKIDIFLFVSRKILNYYWSGETSNTDTFISYLEAKRFLLFYVFEIYNYA